MATFGTMTFGTFPIVFQKFFCSFFSLFIIDMSGQFYTCIHLNNLRMLLLLVKHLFIRVTLCQTSQVHRRWITDCRVGAISDILIYGSNWTTILAVIWLVDICHNVTAPFWNILSPTNVSRFAYTLICLVIIIYHNFNSIALSIIKQLMTF